jgi:hypothetical protein
MLEGNLDEFSIPDVFQLLALTKKSGALRVSDGQVEGRVFFKLGEVYNAVSDVRRMPLGARLVGAGLVTEDQLQRVLDTGQAGGARLAQVILEENTIDEAVLDALVREQIQDAVFEVMRIGSGHFKFDAADDGGEAVGLTMATDQLIMEGTRRLGEWAAILARIPSRDAVLALTPAPPGDGDVALTREQWRLLTLVDGRRTVREVVDLTGQGEYATCLVLCALVDAGYIEVVDPAAGGESTLAALVRRREALRRLEEAELGAPPAPARAAAATPARTATPPPAPASVPVSQPQVQVRDVAPRERQPEPAADPDGDPEPAAQAPRPAPETNGRLDRAQVARELAALGDDEPKPRPVAEPRAAADEAQPSRPLTRDEDVNKGLLLRLIDGVKGA